MKIPLTVWTNGKVTLGMDVDSVLGVLVEDDNGTTSYVALRDVNPDDLVMIDRLVDFTPGFPWTEELHNFLNWGKVKHG